MNSKCLVIHLSGPMCSWGDIAVGSYRGSAMHPSKSAIIGIIAAALGLQREDNEDMMALDRGYDYVIVSSSGSSKIQDYHTVNTGTPKKQEEIYKGSIRASELRREDIYTILTSRDYVCNAYYSVFIIPKDGCRWSLTELQTALKRPCYLPYMGRKSCPFAYPMCPTVHRFSRFFDILTDMSFEPFKKILNDKVKFDSVHVYSTCRIDDDGLKGMTKRVRHDSIRNRSAWQFNERTEYEYSAVI